MKLLIVAVMFAVVPSVLVDDVMWESGWPQSLAPQVYPHKFVPIPDADVAQSTEPQVQDQEKPKDTHYPIAFTNPKPPADSREDAGPTRDDRKDEEFKIYREGNAIQRDMVFTTKVTGIAQFFLALVQAIVAVGAFLNSQKGRREAAAAQRAADRAALAVQRYEISGLQTDGAAEAACYLTNVGHTKAILIESYTGCTMEVDVPPAPDYKRLTPTWTGAKDIHPGDGIWQTADAKFICTAERKAIQGMNRLLFFYGRFVYRDVVGGTGIHETVFFLQYDALRGQFYEVERPGYNYTT